MADGTARPLAILAEGSEHLDAAIAYIQNAEDVSGLTVDIGGGYLAGMIGNSGQAGLLQRLQGWQLLLTYSQAGTVMSKAPMGSSLPQVHPQVASILATLYAAKP